MPSRPNMQEAFVISFRIWLPIGWLATFTTKYAGRLKTKLPVLVADRVVSNPYDQIYMKTKKKTSGIGCRQGG